MDAYDGHLEELLVQYPRRPFIPYPTNPTYSLSGLVKPVVNWPQT